MIRRLWRLETGVFLSFWLLLLITGRSRLFSDPGTFWHTVVGERILTNGELIYTDPFTFTHGGEPWIAQMWLAQCAMAVLHSVGGLDALLLVTATIVAATYAWVAGRLARQGMNAGLVVLVCVLALAASAYHIHPRPQLVNMLLLALTLGWLADVEAGRCPPSRLLWLIPLYILWTNIHGGMVGGVGTLVIAFVGWLVWRLLGGTGWPPYGPRLDTHSDGGGQPVAPLGDWRSSLVIAAAVLACALTPFVNPYGTRMQEVWFGLMGSQALPQLISEHAPLLAEKSHAGGWFVLLFGGVYIVVLLGVLPAWPRVTWLIPLAWLALSWTRIRYGPLFAVSAAVAIGEMWPHVRWAQWLAERGSVLMRLRPQLGESARGAAHSLPWCLPAACVLVAFAFQAAALRVPVLGRGWAQLDPQRWPIGLLPELQAYEQSHPVGTPIFNDMYFGGFLIYHTPGLRIFVDDRCELLGDEELLALVHAQRHDPGQIERWAERFGFELALTEKGSGFDAYLDTSPNWTLVRRDDAASLYRRTLKAPTPTARR